MPRKKTTTDETTETTETPAVAPRLPNVSVLERRLADPMGSATAKIRLKTRVPTEVKGDTWATRWVDSSQQGRVFDVIEHKGWERVHTSELFDENDVAGLAVSVDGGYVTRGDKGREWLCKMPQSWFNKIHMAKVRLWSGADKTKQQRRAGIANQVSQAVAAARNSGAQTLVGPDEAGELTMGLKGEIRHERGPMMSPGDPIEDFA